MVRKRFSDPPHPPYTRLWQPSSGEGLQEQEAANEEDQVPGEVMLQDTSARFHEYTFVLTDYLDGKSINLKR